MISLNLNCLKGLSIVYSFIILVCLLEACRFGTPTEKVTQQELYGVYTANFDAGLADTIFLLEGLVPLPKHYMKGPQYSRPPKRQVYVRRFISKSNITYTDTGAWYTDIPDSGRSFITLLDFKRRFTVHRDDGRTYSEKSGAILDSIPRDLMRPIWKEKGSHGKIVTMGAQYFGTWVKELPEEGDK